MKPVLCVYKPIGMTPLEAIEAVKSTHLEYTDGKISYAGRLDPMAEGLLLLLVGDENKNRKQYENLPKTYEFTVLLGISTDTYDVLGKVTSPSLSSRDPIESERGDLTNQNTGETASPAMLNRNDIEKVLAIFVGKHNQPYPPYSSKTVHGKPLFWWARENKLDEIEIPKREIEMYDLKLLSIDRISNTDLREKITENIAKVHGDFRQEEILASWNTYFQTLPKPQTQIFPLLKCTVTCSSGTYVRSLAVEIGQKLGTPALALSIKRTKVGEYNLTDAIHL